MLDWSIWSLLNVPDPEFMANIGAPPPPIDSRYHTRTQSREHFEHMRHQDLPQNHALPAAYHMWAELSRLASERARSWREAEFEYRRRRAAIMHAIQVEYLHKALLETALDEFHRNEELLEMKSLAFKNAMRKLQNN